MAGLSNRFFKAGYKVPKYKLTLGGESVFAHSVRSFEKYFENDDFLFVIRNVYNTKDFVDSEVRKLGIRHYEIKVLNHETRGQAETAYLGVKDYSGDFPIYIFNIDTFRHGFVKPDFSDKCDAYLEVFKGEGENWSFVEPAEEGLVKKTAEKERISDLCSDGLYYFRSKKMFERIYLEAQMNNETVKNEYYIAPLYNKLIADRRVVKYDLIDADLIEFCGVPDEYRELQLKYDNIKENAV